jgi:hypothetical protein
VGLAVEGELVEIVGSDDGIVEGKSEGGVEAVRVSEGLDDGISER